MAIDRVTVKTIWERGSEIETERTLHTEDQIGNIYVVTVYDSFLSNRKQCTLHVSRSRNTLYNTKTHTDQTNQQSEHVVILLLLVVSLTHSLFF